MSSVVNPVLGHDLRHEPQSDAVAADPALQVEFVNTIDDLRLLVRYGWHWWAPLLMAAAALGCSLPGAVILAVYGHWLVAGLISSLIVVCGLWLLYRSWRAVPAQQAKFLVRRKFTLTPDVFYQQTPESFGRWRWCWLRKVVEFEGSLLVAVEHGWWVIPPSAFTSPEHRLRFCEELTARQRAAVAPAVDEPLPPANLPRDALAVEFTNTPALRRKALARARGGRPGEWQAWVGIAVVAATGWTGMATYEQEAIGFLSAALLHMTCTLVMILIVARSGVWFSRPDWRQRLRERAILTPAGLQFTTSCYEAFVAWNQFEGVEEDDRTIYLIFVKASGQLTAIPKSAFANQVEAGRFLAASREYLDRARAEQAWRGQGASGPGVPASAPKSEETGNPYQPPRA